MPSIQGLRSPSEPRVSDDPPRPPPSDRRGAPDFDRLPDSPSYVAFLSSVGRPSSSSTGEPAVQRRIDDFRTLFGGPYRVGSETVAARPMFRMNGGLNEALLRAREGELSAICRRANVSARALLDAKVGRPTPDELRRVTQALIDAGKLPNGGSLEQRIRRMQWEWGVGVDCAGYTEQAARAARGSPPKPPSHGDVFSGLPNDRSMAKVAVANIRAGDVIHLDPPSRGDVGHNVVVYAHRVASTEDRSAILATRDPVAKAFFENAGPFRLLEVDSSWGAGPDGHDCGGYRRDRWVFDESTRGWLYFEAIAERFATSTIGPHAEPYVGAFRPKTER